MNCCFEREDKEDNLLGVNSKEQDLKLEQNIINAKQYLNSKQYKQQAKNEQTLLENAGLNLNQDLELVNIFLDCNETEWIHTAIIGKKDLNNKKIPYVMIHGYGHSNICFYKIYKQLSSQGRMIYSIDTIGQGLSSRPDFNLTEPQEIIDYFNDSLEQWRKKLGLKKFILVGHSVGGYISANYAMKYPERIANLHLISPIGGTYCNEQINKEYEKFRYNNMSWFFKRLYNNIIKPKWQKQTTPETIGSSFFVPLSYIVKRYTTKRLGLQGEEQKAYYDYLYEAYQMKSSTSRCLHKLFYFPKLGPYISLEIQMPKLYKNKDQQVHFYFGDIDWMNFKGAKNIIENKKVNGTFTIISKAGHNVQFDNGPELVKNIIKNDKFLEQI